MNVSHFDLFSVFTLAAICYTRPRSCLDLIKSRNSVPPNGYYRIYDDNGCHNGNAMTKGLLVFCDFQSEVGYAWTLVESFARINARSYAIGKGFSYSSRKNANSPYQNWGAYRLPLSQMRQLQQVDSRLTSDAMWRATCNFNPYARSNYFSSNDYLRGQFSVFNILSYDSLTGDCYMVDSVRIRGFYCERCMVPFWAGGDIHLHIDSSGQCCRRHFYDSLDSEDNFGYYYPYNTAFSCTSASNSTTNWWIGGKIRSEF